MPATETAPETEVVPTQAVVVKKGYQIKSIDKGILNGLVRDFHYGLIFSDAHLKASEKKLVSIIFTPLLTLGAEMLEGLNENPPGLYYEYLADAGGIQINGLPIFDSVRMMNKKDAKYLLKKVRLLERAEASIVGRITPTGDGKKVLKLLPELIVDSIDDNYVMK
jgi:hypothetical protein